ARSYKAVVTNALSAADSMPFVAAGFSVRERLHLLAHDLHQLPPIAGATRRARRHDHGPVLDLDATAFDAEWRLDDGGLAEVLRATPVTRFRVPPELASTISGYAVTGRSGRTGYLQRIAVHADARRRGHGRALVADALRWLSRRSVDRALVNTQLDNDAALALYVSSGFRRLPVGLCVLGRTLGGAPPRSWPRPSLRSCSEPCPREQACNRRRRRRRLRPTRCVWCSPSSRRG